LMASTAGDLISQVSIASKADISNVYSAAGTVLYPYYDPAETDVTQPDAAKPTIRITSVIDDGSGAAGQNHLTGKVAWTCTQSGSGSLPAAPALNSSVTLPQPLMTDKGSIVIADISYLYTSPTSKMINKSITFTNRFYAKPRRVAQIATPTGGCP